MAIYLGNPTTEQIAKRLGIELTPEEKTALAAFEQLVSAINERRIQGGVVYMCSDRLAAVHAEVLSGSGNKVFTKEEDGGVEHEESNI